VWISHREGERCAACAVEIERGTFIQMNREQGIRCVRCAGFGDLVFLPAGDTALTRRALALSTRTAIVVKFSRARRRHERQGALVELFSACPPPEATVIARRACEKYSRRVGRSAAAKALDAEAVTLAVGAHIRHAYTGYEKLLARGLEPAEARRSVAGSIERRLREWQRAAQGTS
jgi:hypothetical protein